MLDTAAAEALGISDLAAGPMVYLGDDPYAVVGIYQAPAGEAQITNAMVVPYRACEDGWSNFAEATVAIRTDLGAADEVGALAALALEPTAPQSVKTLVPADLRTFRVGVERDTQSLFFGLAAVSLIIGALGISNTTLVSVLERRSEIGLRRAVGASRSAVAGQFLIESAIFGVGGGLLGAIIGINVTTAVCLVRDWVLILDPAFVAATPVLGLVVGMLAGVYPAYIAARVAPAATLRA